MRSRFHHLDILDLSQPKISREKIESYHLVKVSFKKYFQDTKINKDCFSKTNGFLFFCIP